MLGKSFSYKLLRVVLFIVRRDQLLMKAHYMCICDVDCKKNDYKFLPFLYICIIILYIVYLYTYTLCIHF